MFYSIVIMLKGAAGIVWRVDIDTFYFAGEFLFHGFKGKEVVAENEAVVEYVFIAGTVFGVVAFGCVFQ
jgi:hypothetical protein